MIQRTKAKSNKNGTPEPIRKLEDLSAHELKMLSWYRVFGIPWSESNSDTYREEEMAWDIVRFRMFEAYRAGEMKLEPLLRHSAKVLDAFRIPRDMQRRMLGEITGQALKTVPASGPGGARGRPKGSRRPSWLPNLAASMVDEAVCDGLARDRRPGQAFDSVREHLHSMGIAASPRQIESWDKEHRRSSDTLRRDAEQSPLSEKKK